MILIKAIERSYQDVDENGQAVTRSILEPETPIPASATRVVCDGVNYVVYEPSDD